VDVITQTLRIDAEREAALKLSRRFSSESAAVLPSAQFWRDSRALKVLGMGTALPGPPVSTADLLARVEKRFGVGVTRRGSSLANRLKIATRHLCRDFEARQDVPRRGH
jgi:hypothetical protein